MRDEQLPSVSEKNISQLPAMQLLNAMGYNYVSNQNGLEGRGSKFGTIYKDILLRKLEEINSFEYKGEKRKFSGKTLQQAIADIDVPITEGLIYASESIYNLLFTGKSYAEELPDGSKKSYTLRFIDWNNIGNNEFTFTNEFEVENEKQSGYKKENSRPDIVCFVNGIPFAMIECKKASVSVEQGVEQAISYQKTWMIPHLYKFSQLVLATNKNETLYATTATSKKFWNKWKEQDGEWMNKCLKEFIKNRIPTNQDKDIISLLHPKRLLELVRFFILYDNKVKKIARYQQYFAVKEIVKTIEQQKEDGSRQSGTIWHTQGSGKSLTMVMFARYIATTMSTLNPKVVVVTDRIELDKQITKTFFNTGLKAMRATSGKKLIGLINNDNADIVTTILNKFEAASEQKEVNESKEIFVLVDEGHRSNYGEFYIKMKRVFPNACYLAFTGTPLLRYQKNTVRQFGHKLIHQYTISDGVDDKQIVPLLYEGRMVDQNVNQRGIDNQLEIIIRNLNEDQKQQVKRKWSKYSKIASSEQRLKLIAFDIYTHFTKNFQTAEGQFKAILACNSKAEAIKYQQAFEELGGPLKTAVVFSPPDSREGDVDVEDENPELIKNYYTKMIKGYRDYEDYEESMKNEFIEGDELDMLIVVDKLLTGFDAPRATVLYLDKNLKEHSLLQAIARVNRLYEGKEYGFIIDYRGLIEELNTALGMYSGAGDLKQFDADDIRAAVIDVMKIVGDLRQGYSQLLDLFKKVANKVDMEEYEVMLEDNKARNDFYDLYCNFNKNLGYALSSEKVYNSLDDEEISKYKKTLKFFQELRTSVSRRYSDSIDHKAFEPKLQKLIDNYIVAEDVMQVTNPINILDVKQFEEELERMGSPRAKADMIRTRMTKSIETKYSFNPTYYTKFSEMIQEVIDAYRANRISDVDYLEKMQKILNLFQKGYDSENIPKQLKGNDRAIAFYGTIEKLLKEGGLTLSCEDLLLITNNIERIVLKNIKVDWRNNDGVHKAIDQDIEDFIYEFEKGKETKISLTTIDQITNDIKTIAKNY
ncbi:MAG: HsdR family type I site-specific deoxyribonuclease [Firmicutes bacterium]|nr:HsdR family type I site-specific deoxyribonuclease [Bacillota bacterium]